MGDPRDPKPGDRFRYRAWDGESNDTYTIVSRNRWDSLGDSIVIKYDHSEQTNEWYTRDIEGDIPVE